MIRRLTVPSLMIAISASLALLSLHSTTAGERVHGISILGRKG